MNKPILSIIIPVYNSEKYIRRTLKNVVKYCSDCEVIIVNDGSTDSTSKILKDYNSKYDNIKCYDKTNGGVSSARNFGLNKATGEYILFLDSDDLLIKSILNIKRIIKQTNVDIIKCDYLAQRRIKISFNYNVCFKDRNEGSVDINYIHRMILTTTNFNSVCFNVFKRKLIKNIRFDIKYIMAEDLDFNIKLYDIAKTVYYYPKPIIKYMYNNSSATRIIDLNRYKKQIKDICEVYSKLYFYNKKWNINIDNFLIEEYIDSICSYIINSKKRYSAELHSYYLNIKNSMEV